MKSSTMTNADADLIAMFEHLDEERENDMRNNDDIAAGTASPACVRLPGTPARTLAGVKVVVRAAGDRAEPATSPLPRQPRLESASE